MIKNDIVEEISRIASSRGSITFEEIYEAFPPDLFSHNEIEEFIYELQSNGINIISSEDMEESTNERVYSESDESSLTRKVLEKIRLKLLDLSKRNRLLNFRESARSIRIIDELPDQTFDFLIREGTDMVLIPLPEEDGDGDEDETQDSLINEDDQESSDIFEDGGIDTSHELPLPSDTIKEKHKDNYLQTPFTARPLERRCKKLAQESRTSIDETGSNLLYLAIGFVEWYEDENSSKSYKAPLILVPVQLERSRIDRKTNCYNYILSYTEEDIETNLSLAEMLSKDYDLILPEIDESISPEEYFDKVSDMVKNLRHWRVNREMVIGMFSFTKLLMYKDLDPSKWPNESILSGRHLPGILGSSSTPSPKGSMYGEEYDIDENHSFEQISLIRDADSSQHSAIMDVLNNTDLVIDGPPGTGKSQTITNIIAAALHNGKSVLFLAEKKAALEVVRRRLDQAGIGDFCLELHSHKTKKGKLHADIKRRLERKFLDPIDLQRDLDNLIEERDKLRSFAALINTTVGPYDETIHDILWRAERWQSEVEGRDINFSVSNASEITKSEISDRVNVLEEIERLVSELPSYVVNAWIGFYPESILPGDEKEVGEILSNILENNNEFQKYLNDKNKINGFPIELKIGSLKSVSSADLSVLKKIPDDYEQEAAIKLLEPYDREIIRELDMSVREYSDLIMTSREFLGNVDELLLDDIKKMDEACNVFIDLSYDDKTIHDIRKLPNVADEVINSLSLLRELSDDIAEIIEETPIVFDDFERFMTFIDLINDAPDDIDINAHQAHVMPYASKLLYTSRDDLISLKSDIMKYSNLFDISSMPRYDEVKRLAITLLDADGKFFSFLSSNVRKARRDISRFTIQRKKIKDIQVINKLNTLSDMMKRAYEARKNPDCVRVLGPLFTGTDTNWQALEGHVKWAHSLRDALKSEALAGRVVSNVSLFRDKLKKIAVRIKQLMENVNVGVEDLMFDIDPYLDVKILSDKIDDLKNKILSKSKILEKYISDNKADISGIKRCTDSYISANHLKSMIESDVRFSELVANQYKGINTETDGLCNTCDWIELLFAQANIHINLLQWVVKSDTRNRVNIISEVVDKIESYFNMLNTNLKNLNDLGRLNRDSFWDVAEDSCSLNRISEKIESCLNQIGYLVTWSDYCRSLQGASDLGLGSITEALLNKEIAPDKCTANYLAGLYRSISKEIIRKHPELSNFTRAKIENIKDHFIELDKKIIKRRGHKIAYEASKREVPVGVGYGYVRDYTELSLIKKEISKKRRHIPIRQLVKRSVKALQGLKPCYMMSPLSVAQYLVPGQISFDLVIMDEASQIRPEDALGAIARASQIVVVGDENQLPPTTFFERINEDIEEDEETAMEDVESILDRCKDIYQRRRLRWHYRSEHESLIAFSNRQFYDNDLIVFPSPYYKNKQLGVRSNYVEGATYSKGKNLVEAEAVSRAVMKHMKQSPNLSLGVVTFNREQRDLIEDVLDKHQKRESWIEIKIKETEGTDEPFFIKNLENVQGDERDVIFISTTYGSDPETGKVYQRFGPVGGKTGWRRLNVMFTRAKKRVEVFTSMLPTDIKPSDSTSRGIIELKTYLEYAQHGCFRELGTITDREPDSDFEISVARILKSYGFNTVPQVGVAGFFIDIGVMNPHRESEFILGIECDGATYHAAKSVRDRDRLRQEILESKGWKIHRIWSTDWFKNREKEVDRLLNRIREIVEEDKSTVYQEGLTSSDYVEEDESTEDIYEEATSESSYSQDGNLKDDLIKYRQNVIEGMFPDLTGCMLRDEMLEYFAERKPTTMDDFRSKIPLRLRERTNRDQVQFLRDIFEIIENYE